MNLIVIITGCILRFVVLISIIVTNVLLQLAHVIMVLDMLELQHYSCVQFAGLYVLCADLLFKWLFIAHWYCDNNQSPLNRYATSVFTDMESVAQKYCIFVQVSCHERRPSQLTALNEMPLYPTEEIIWDENIVPLDYVQGDGRSCAAW